MAAAAPNNHLVKKLVKIATDYIKYIKTLFSVFGYDIKEPTQPEEDGVYYFKLLHNKTTEVGVIGIAPFLKYKGEYRIGPLKRGRESTITNILHIHSLFIDIPEYRRMGLGTILILYSICHCYIINQDFSRVTVDDDTASKKSIGLDTTNMYLKLGFFPLLNLVELHFKGKTKIIQLQGRNSSLRDPGLIADISYLIGVTVPIKQREPEKAKLHANLQKRQAQMNAETAEMNVETAQINAGTRKTRRYRKKQKKTRRYRR